MCLYEGILAFHYVPPLITLFSIISLQFEAFFFWRLFYNMLSSLMFFSFVYINLCLALFSKLFSHKMWMIWIFLPNYFLIQCECFSLYSFHNYKAYIFQKLQLEVKQAFPSCSKSFQRFSWMVHDNWMPYWVSVYVLTSLNWWIFLWVNKY